MTVGELRKALDGKPDNLPVVAWYFSGDWSVRRDIDYVQLTEFTDRTTTVDLALGEDIE